MFARKHLKTRISTVYLHRIQKLASNRRLAVSLEKLEPRHLSAADLRTFDGTGNNLANPEWGSTFENYVRNVPAAYSDGISTPAGVNRASARAVSNLLATQGTLDLVNDRNLSAFVYAWGQFLDHDIDLTDSAKSGEKSNIAIPKGDAYFDPTGTGTEIMEMVRSNFSSQTGTSMNNPRQQVNSITAFIDASQVYGSSTERANALRTFQGGLMKISSGNLLPFNTLGLENATPSGAISSEYFLAGDVRANENIELTAMQTLFVREHNQIATSLAKANPSWNDEQLYQAARRWVAAEMQVITYKEFLPAILGDSAVAPYRGYNPQVNPGIANEFATAAFRFGHSMLGADIEFLDNNGTAVRAAVELRDSFFSPRLIQSEGIDEIFKYLASDRAQEIDTRVVDDLRNFLFGPPGSGGFDLAALNIQRGRDHGLADYNSTRLAYGLKPVTSFADITTDKALQQLLKTAYGSVDRIDLWIGGLAESHAPGASVGPLFQKIIASQFQRLRDGDRFWYQRDFQGRELVELENTRLADIIRRNTTTQNLQPNVFEFRVEIAGFVAMDGNRNGRIDDREQGMAGITVQLQDSVGVIIASTLTDRNGRYQFEGLDLGSYRVRIVTPSGMIQTTVNPADIPITKGGRIDRVDFGIARNTAPPPRVPGRPQLIVAASTPDLATIAADSFFSSL